MNPPEAILEPIFQDKTRTPPRHRPIEYAIDGNDETAWGIDVGPGLRNQPRKAVFAFETPVSLPGGTIFTVKLKQEHGGWNANDNQTQQPRPVPPLRHFRRRPRSRSAARRTCATFLAIAAKERTPEQTTTVFSYWRTTVAEWKQANDEIDALWKRASRGRNAARAAIAATRPRNAHADTRRLPASRRT